MISELVRPFISVRAHPHTEQQTCVFLVGTWVYIYIVGTDFNIQFFSPPKRFGSKRVSAPDKSIKQLSSSCHVSVHHPIMPRAIFIYFFFCCISCLIKFWMMNLWKLGFLPKNVVMFIIPICKPYAEFCEPNGLYAIDYGKFCVFIRLLVCFTWWSHLHNPCIVISLLLHCKMRIVISLALCKWKKNVFANLTTVKIGAMLITFWAVPYTYKNNFRDKDGLAPQRS